MARTMHRNPDGSRYFIDEKGQMYDATGRLMKNTSQSTSQPTSYLDLFKDKSYSKDSDFQNIVKSYEDQAKKFNVYDQNRQPTSDQLTGYVDTFVNQFKNYVGRDPNESEYNQFFKFLGKEAPATRESEAFGGSIGPKVTGLIKDYYTRTAQDEAEKKFANQSEAAVAPGSAFDVWQNEYRNSLGGVEKALTDYQTRLFEKIRPNLITSLKAQGLLDTGALNEAFAGTAGDLTAANTNYLAGAKGSIEQDIANNKYALKSAPTTYQFQNTTGGPANLINSGQNALQNVWQEVLQQNEFNNQKALLGMQPQPSSNPLAQYGGLIVGGMAGGLPGAFANYAANRYATNRQYPATPGYKE